MVIGLAWRTGFLDHPVGYKRHLSPTPLLGGSLVFAGFVVALIPLAGTYGKLALIPAGAAVLWMIGTRDDRRPVAPAWRLLAELVLAAGLVESGLGWHFLGSDVLNLLLTALWIIGVVNAVNLLDNIDGAAATVGGVGSAGICAFAVAHGDYGIGAMSLTLSGACLGFLPHNLARPSRIFLGDGGSMPMGFLLAALAMNAVDRHISNATALLAAGLLIGLPILDTSLVVVSRLRRRLSILTAGRDHLTHRLLFRLGSARRVALALAVGQALLAGLAIVGDPAGGGALPAISTAVLVQGLLAILVLETAAWARKAFTGSGSEASLSAERPAEAELSAPASTSTSELAPALEAGVGRGR